MLLRGFDGLRFETSNGNGSFLTFNPIGNLGIGTDNPTYKLDVSGNARVCELDITPVDQINEGAQINLRMSDYTGTWFIDCNGPTNAQNLRFIRQNNGQLANVLLQINNNGNVGIGTDEPNVSLDVNGAIYSNSNIYSQNLTMVYGSPSSAIYTLDATNLNLGTNNNASRLTIKTDGNVGIGINNPSYKLDVNGTIHATNVIFPLNNNNNNNIDACIVADGTIKSTQQVVSSDRRIKRDIEEIPDDESLIKLRQIQPKKYNYINRHTDEKVYGFIAQEVSDVIPDSVFIRTEPIPDILKNGILKWKNEKWELSFEEDVELKQGDVLEVSINNVKNELVIENVLSNRLSVVKIKTPIYKKVEQQDYSDRIVNVKASIVLLSFNDDDKSMIDVQALITYKDTVPYLVFNNEQDFVKGNKLLCSYEKDLFTATVQNSSSDKLEFQVSLTKTWFVEREILDLDDKNVSVFGHIVNDFMNLKKDYLYALHFSATQQLDKQLTLANKELEEHKKKLNEQTVINENLQKQINELKKVLKF